MKTENTALLLIDIQNDYFPGGKMELSGTVDAGDNAGRILDACRMRGITVVHIQHLSVRAGAGFFIPGTEGAEINRVVAPIPGETVIQKNFPNSFRNTDLLDYLKNRNITELLICGMMTHMCIDATVRAAFDYGFECTVAGDACATRNLSQDGVEIPALHVHHAFLAALGSVYAKRLNTGDLIKFITI